MNQLLGVMAHETGHITGGHLARGAEAYKGASNLSIASLVLGAAAILAGSPDAGMAAMMAGQTAAQRNFLAYNRVQESSADQAGATFLEKAGISGDGLIEFFGKLQQQELLSRIAQDPYVRTHPLNRDRILRLQGRVEESAARDIPMRADWQERFLRLKGKALRISEQARQDTQDLSPVGPVCRSALRPCLCLAQCGRTGKSLRRGARSGRA